MPEHDLVVIGAGPGGYVAAIRAAQLGMNVACIDENEQLGGTCLRVGCIPSKAMLESSELYYQAKHSFEEHGVKLGRVELDLTAMLRRKDKIVDSLTRGVKSLLKKNKITHYQGRGRIDGAGRAVVSQNGKSTQLAAKHILIATGSRSASLRGIETDGERIVTSTEALAFAEVPKHLVVIGGGYIGLEMGSVWLRLGAKVTVLEALDRILAATDTEIASKTHKLLEKQGMEFRLNCRVKGAKNTGKKVKVEIEGADTIECDRLLVAVGRTANTTDLGLECVGVKTDRAGVIEVDENFATSAKGIYAIGDCIPGPMLAHKASEEGIACVEKIAGLWAHVNYDTIPAVVYIHPEVASVGKSEEQLKKSGIEYNKGAFPFPANGRAKTLGDSEGLVKILADKKTDRVLGVHILGPRAGDLIHEAAAAMEFGATSEDIVRVCHAHPTLAEAVHEAALAVSGRAIHF
jgi:dihydrolipoamide dehydrogenase